MGGGKKKYGYGDLGKIDAISSAQAAGVKVAASQPKLDKVKKNQGYNKLLQLNKPHLIGAQNDMIRKMMNNKQSGSQKSKLPSVDPYGDALHINPDNIDYN